MSDSAESSSATEDSDAYSSSSVSAAESGEAGRKKGSMGEVQQQALSPSDLLENLLKPSSTDEWDRFLTTMSYWTTAKDVMDHLYGVAENPMNRQTAITMHAFLSFWLHRHFYSLEEDGLLLERLHALSHEVEQGEEEAGRTAQSKASAAAESELGIFRSMFSGEDGSVTLYDQSAPEATPRGRKRSETGGGDVVMIANYDFEGAGMEFKKGDKIVVLKTINGQYYEGEVMSTGRRGLFPSNYASRFGRIMSPREEKQPLYFFANHGISWLLREKRAQKHDEAAALCNIFMLKGWIVGVDGPVSAFKAGTHYYRLTRFGRALSLDETAVRDAALVDVFRELFSLLPLKPIGILGNVFPMAVDVQVAKETLLKLGTSAASAISVLQGLIDDGYLGCCDGSALFSRTGYLYVTLFGMSQPKKKNSLPSVPEAGAFSGQQAGKKKGTPKKARHTADSTTSNTSSPALPSMSAKMSRKSGSRKKFSGTLSRRKGKKLSRNSSAQTSEESSESEGIGGAAAGSGAGLNTSAGERVRFATPTRKRSTSMSAFEEAFREGAPSAIPSSLASVESPTQSPPISPRKEKEAGISASASMSNLASLSGTMRRASRKSRSGKNYATLRKMRTFLSSDHSTLSSTLDMPRLRPDSMLFIEMDVKEVAQQLTHRMWKMYTAVHAGHLIGQNWRKQADAERNRHPINLLVEEMNLIGGWVASEILTVVPGYAKPLEMLHKVIELAEELRELRNYSGCLAVVVGLSMHCIDRLQKTLWEQLGRGYAETWARLKALGDPSSSYKTYRRELQECATPPTLPHLGVVLQDLTFIEDGNPTFVHEGLVNCAKLRMAHQVASEFLRWQKADNYSHAPVTEVQTWLQDYRFALPEAALYAQSYKLERRATRIAPVAITE